MLCQKLLLGFCWLNFQQQKQRKPTNQPILWLIEQAAYRWCRSIRWGYAAGEPRRSRSALRSSGSAAPASLPRRGAHLASVWGSHTRHECSVNSKRALAQRAPLLHRTHHRHRQSMPPSDTAARA
eukprot:SAG25_NODE_80_length_16705_cov_9.579746_16_plen_125_part_00